MINFHLSISSRSEVENWWSQIPGKVMQGCIPVWAPIWWEKETATLQSWLSSVRLSSNLCISFFSCFCDQILERKQLSKGASEGHSGREILVTVAWCSCWLILHLQSRSKETWTVLLGLYFSSKLSTGTQPHIGHI